MQVQRIVKDVTSRQLVIDLPESFINEQVEVIVLTLDREVEPAKVRRRPPPELRSTVILRDILEPVISAEEWEKSLERTARQIEGDPDAFK